MFWQGGGEMGTHIIGGNENGHNHFRELLGNDW